MNLPSTVTPEALAAMATPDETLAVRVLIRRTANTGLQTLRGRFRRYIAKRDDKLGCHVIEIPLSIWMAGVPGGTYHDNLSVAHDIMGNRPATKAPLVLLVVPWTGAKKAEAEPEQAKVTDLRSLRELAEVLGAPELLLSAIDLAASDRTQEEIDAALRATITNVLGEPPKIDPPPVADAPTLESTYEMITGRDAPKAPVTDRPAAKKAAKKKTLTNAERQKLHRQKKRAEREKNKNAGAIA